MLTKTGVVYQETPSPQYLDNGRTRGLVTGRNLAHAKRSIPERAFVAADLHLNHVELISPTIKQSACLADICVPYAAAAIAIAASGNGAARAAVLAGDETILDVAKAVAPESLTDHLARASQSEWLEAARTVGPAVIWDRMIAPLV